VTPDPPEDNGTFGDEGAGPDEPESVLDDPTNQAAAQQIRDSTIDGSESA